MESSSSQSGTAIVIVLFVLSNIALVIFIVFFIRKYLLEQSNERKNSQQRQLLATTNNYSYTPSVTNFIVYGSYPIGEVNDILGGYLPTSRNEFFAYVQKEVRSSGKNSVVYSRSVMVIEIPDVVSHFIFNSKLNNTANTGGNLEQYSKSQILGLEGNFSEFFDILVPNGDENDALTILSPNAMQYLLSDLASYDIEVVANKLLIYAYKIIDVTELQSIISKADRLVALLKLRAGDVRINQSMPLNSTTQQQVVARTAIDNQAQRKLKRTSFLKFTTIGVLGYVVITFVAPKYKGIAWLVVVLSVIVTPLYTNVKLKRLKRRYEQSMNDLAQQPPAEHH
jgi:hypothetical protein